MGRIRSIANCHQSSFIRLAPVRLLSPRTFASPATIQTAPATAFPTILVEGRRAEADNLLHRVALTTSASHIPAQPMNSWRCSFRDTNVRPQGTCMRCAYLSLRTG